MLIDLHAHTKAISHCCRADAEAVIKTAKEYGFDGIVITNHYTNAYFTDDNQKEWVEKYISEWENCRELGSSLGVRIFCGVEVTMEYDPRVHILIYGANEGFLRENLTLCDMSQEELYMLCRKNGYAVVQAHPFRGGTTVQDTRFLDGVEINCHPLYKNSYSDKLWNIAKENNLALTVGCDYHKDTYRAVGGVFLPESINTDKELSDFILTSNSFKLQIHEPATQEIYQKEYLITR